MNVKSRKKTIAKGRLNGEGQGGPEFGYVFTPERFGEFLRRERETRKISHRDVYEATRIQIHFVEAIERGDFGSLPARPILNGFVRSLARYIGLKPEDVMAKFEEAADIYYAANARKGRDINREERGEAIREFFLYVIIIVIIAVVVFFFVRESNFRHEKVEKLKETKSRHVDGFVSEFKQKMDEDVISKEEVKETGVSEEKAKVAEEEKAEAPPGQSVSTEKPPEKGLSVGEVVVPETAKDEFHMETDLVEVPKVEKVESGLELTISANEMSWLNVNVDDKESHDIILRKGEKISWKGEKGFKMIIGNAGGVDITLNGKVMGPYGKKGQVAKVYLAEKDLR